MGSCFTAQGAQPGAVSQPRVWHGIRGESDFQEGGAVCTLTADSCVVW